LTGSKLETAITAPKMTPSTTPPDTILSKKFFSDGDNPDCAASAISGTTIAAASAATVTPVKAFSFREALTTTQADRAFLDLTEPTSGVKAPVPSLLWATAGAANIGAKVEAHAMIAVRWLGALVCGEMREREGESWVFAYDRRKETGEMGGKIEEVGRGAKSAACCRRGGFEVHCLWDC
jgi:hypothetical protein